MSSFLSIAGPILKSSNLFQSGAGKKAKGDEKSEFPSPSSGSRDSIREKNVNKTPVMPAFGEDEDEEDEEDDGGF